MFSVIALTLPFALDVPFVAPFLVSIFLSLYLIVALFGLSLTMPVVVHAAFKRSGPRHLSLIVVV